MLPSNNGRFSWIKFVGIITLAIGFFVNFSFENSSSSSSHLLGQETVLAKKVKHSESSSKSKSSKKSSNSDKKKSSSSKKSKKKSKSKSKTKHKKSKSDSSSDSDDDSVSPTTTNAFMVALNKLAARANSQQSKKGYAKDGAAIKHTSNSANSTHPADVGASRPSGGQINAGSAWAFMGPKNKFWNNQTATTYKTTYVDLAQAASRGNKQHQRMQNVFKHYSAAANFGYALYSTGLDHSTKAGFYRNNVANSVTGSLMLVCYYASSSVEKLFRFGVNLLSYLNPFNWVLNGSSIKNPVIAPVARVISNFYKISRSLGVMFMAIAFITTVVLCILGLQSINQYSGPSSGRSVLGGLITLLKRAFVLFALPVIGMATFSGMLNNMKYMYDMKSSSVPVWAVYSNFIDFQNWVMNSRLALPLTPASSNKRATIIELPSQYKSGGLPVVDHAEVLKLNAYAAGDRQAYNVLNDKWVSSLQETANGTTPKKYNAEQAISLINQWRSNDNSIQASDFASYVQGYLQKEFNTERQQKKKSKNKKQEKQDQIKRDLTSNLYTTNGLDESYNHAFTARKAKTYTNKPLSPTEPGGLSTMGMYAYLLSNCKSQSIFMSNSVKLSNDVSSPSHQSVGLVGNGFIAFSNGFIALAMMACVTILALGFMFFTWEAVMENLLAIFAGLGFSGVSPLAGGVKVTCSFLGMIISVFGSSLLYLLFSKLLIAGAQAFDSLFNGSSALVSSTASMLHLNNGVAFQAASASINGAVYASGNCLEALFLLELVRFFIRMRGPILSMYTEGLESFVNNLLRASSAMSGSSSAGGGTNGAIQQSLGGVGAEHQNYVPSADSAARGAFSGVNKAQEEQEGNQEPPFASRAGEREFKAGANAIERASGKGKHGKGLNGLTSAEKAIERKAAKNGSPLSELGNAKNLAKDVGALSGGKGAKKGAQEIGKVADKFAQDASGSGKNVGAKGVMNGAKDAADSAKKAQDQAAQDAKSAQPSANADKALNSATDLNHTPSDGWNKGKDNASDNGVNPNQEPSSSDNTNNQPSPENMSFRPQDDNGQQQNSGNVQQQPEDNQKSYPSDNSVGSIPNFDDNGNYDGTQDSNNDNSLPQTPSDKKGNAGKVLDSMPDNNQNKNDMRNNQSGQHPVQGTVPKANGNHSNHGNSGNRQSVVRPMPTGSPANQQQLRRMMQSEGLNNGISGSGSQIGNNSYGVPNAKGISSDVPNGTSSGSPLNPSANSSNPADSVGGVDDGMLLNPSSMSSAYDTGTPSVGASDAGATNTIANDAINGSTNTVADGQPDVQSVPSDNIQSVPSDNSVNSSSAFTQGTSSHVHVEDTPQGLIKAVDNVGSAHRAYEQAQSAFKAVPNSAPLKRTFVEAAQAQHDAQVGALRTYNAQAASKFVSPLIRPNTKSSVGDVSKAIVNTYQSRQKLQEAVRTLGKDSPKVGALAHQYRSAISHAKSVGVKSGIVNAKADPRFLSKAYQTVRKNQKSIVMGNFKTTSFLGKEVNI